MAYLLSLAFVLSAPAGQTTDYERGLDLYAAGELDRARLVFAKLVNRLKPGTELHASTLYNLARIEQQQQEQDGSARHVCVAGHWFRQYLQVAPGSGFASEEQLTRAREGDAAARAACPAGRPAGAAPPSQVWGASAALSESALYFEGDLRRTSVTIDVTGHRRTDALRLDLGVGVGLEGRSPTSIKPGVSWLGDGPYARGAARILVHPTTALGVEAALGVQGPSSAPVRLFGELDLTLWPQSALLVEFGLRAGASVVF